MLFVLMTLAYLKGFMLICNAQREHTIANRQGSLLLYSAFFIQPNKLPKQKINDTQYCKQSTSQNYVFI